MTDIPFTKAHGAKNDFLLTWHKDLVGQVFSLPTVAQAICDRYTGVGADGWILVDEDAIELYNSDGSKPEISGNGTRCAAAFLLRSRTTPSHPTTAPHPTAASTPTKPSNNTVRSEPRTQVSGLPTASETLTIKTGAGPKHLKLLRQNGPEYWFEMNMGKPTFIADHFPLEISGELTDVTILNVGNPQCAVPVDNFDFDWRAMGREIEKHPHFPKRTNVSFIRKVNAHTIDVRFYERGAGETMSSGTGSTGAVATAIRRGLVTSPVRVLTPAGPLELRWDESIFLTGPAVLTVDGIFHYESIE
jgi:diaminopimelate epimerase